MNTELDISKKDIADILNKHPQIITETDVEFEKASTQYESYLFHYNGGLYRAPYKKYRNIILNHLSEHPFEYLQKTEKTNIVFSYEDKLLPVYKHKFYDHLVCLMSSTAARSRKYLSVICQINKKLIKSNMILKDIHAHNIAETIDGIIFYDVGSVQPLQEPSAAQIGWRNVLEMVSKYMFKSEPVASINEIIGLDSRSVLSWEKLGNIILTEPIKQAPYTHWNNEYNRDLNCLNLETSKKGPQIMNIIDEINADTVTDVGCNKGYFSFYAAKKAKSVIGFDVDEGCIDECIRLNEEKYKLPAMFAKIDISKFFNLTNHIIRYRSELVLALAIVHHLSGISHQEFAKFLSDLSKKYILIEDIGTCQIYEKEFLNLGFKLIKRIDSWPIDRMLSLYKRG